MTLLVGVQQDKILEVLSDGEERDALTILSLGGEVLHLGTILKVLVDMEEAMLVSVRWEGNNRYYLLTEEGRKQCKVVE